MARTTHLSVRPAAVIRSLVAAAALVLAMPNAAHAAPSANVQSPRAGTAVQDTTGISVQVSRESGFGAESISSVSVRLSVDGRNAMEGSQVVSLRCVSGCGTDDQTWGGVMLSPTDGSPFTEGQVCNGRYFLQPSVNGGAFQAGVSFALSGVPDAPTGLQATGDGSNVYLRWSESPDPDVTGFRLERRGDDGSWTSLLETGADTTSFTDRRLRDGRYDYRVWAQRGDGMVDGKPADVCTDTEQDLETASSVRSVTIGEPEPEPSPSPSSGTGGTNDGGGSTSDGSSADGGGSTSDSGSSTSGGGSTDGNDGGEDGNSTSTGDTGDDPDTRPSSGSRPPRIAPPPSARRSTSVGGGAPDLPDAEVAQPRERYYGEDEEFSEEIDYNAIDPVTGEPIRRDGTVEIEQRVAGGFASEVVSSLNQRLILVPVAGGLVLSTVALHLRRWTRESS